jgi:hypothetical protein
MDFEFEGIKVVSRDANKKNYSKIILLSRVHGSIVG